MNKKNYDEQRLDLIQQRLYEGKTFQEIADELNVSKQRIDQIVKTYYLVYSKTKKTKWLCYLPGKFWRCATCQKSLNGDVNLRANPDANNYGFICGACASKLRWNTNPAYRKIHKAYTKVWKEKNAEQAKVIQKRAAAAWYKRNHIYHKVTHSIKYRYPDKNDPERIRLLQEAQILKVYVRGPFKNGNQ